jgi:hypothetical protein
VALFIIVLVVLIALSVYSKVRLLGRIIKAVRGEPAKRGSEGDMNVAPRTKKAKVPKNADGADKDKAGPKAGDETKVDLKTEKKDAKPEREKTNK